MDFLEQFGHVDFFLLDFLPKIRTVPEFKQIRDRERAMDPRMIRTQELLSGTKVDLE